MGMGPASLQEEEEEDREPEKGPEEEMESYHYLLRAGSQLESTLQREYRQHCPPYAPTLSGPLAEVHCSTSLIHDVYVQPLREVTSRSAPCASG